MDLLWLGLYFPTLVQYAMFIAIALSNAVSFLLESDAAIAEDMVSYTLCYVHSYGSHVCSGIPVTITLLLS